MYKTFKMKREHKILTCYTVEHIDWSVGNESLWHVNDIKSKVKLFILHL